MTRSPLPATALAVLLLAAGACGAPSARPEPDPFPHEDEVRRGEGFVVLADRRVFATMAFLNATGFDDEAEGVSMHPVRRRVRALLAEALAAAKRPRGEIVDMLALARRRLEAAGPRGREPLLILEKFALRR